MEPSAKTAGAGIRHVVRGYFWATASVVCWGVMFPVGRILMAGDALAPSMVAMLRYLIAAPILFAAGFALHGRGMLPRRASDWPALAGLGLVGSALMAFLLFVAQRQGVSSIASSLLEAYVPIQVLLLGLLAGRKAGARQVAGILLGFLGSLFVLKAVDFRGIQLARISLGDLWIFLSGLCWALYTAWGRPLARRMGGLPFTAWTVLAGGLWLLAYNLATGQTALPATGGEWSGILFLALCPTALAFFGWNAAQRDIPLSRLSFMEYFTPIVAALGGLAIHEPVSAGQWLGTAIVILSAALQ